MVPVSGSLIHHGTAHVPVIGCVQTLPLFAYMSADTCTLLPEPYSQAPNPNETSKTQNQQKDPGPSNCFAESSTREHLCRFHGTSQQEGLHIPALKPSPPLNRETKATWSCRGQRSAALLSPYLPETRQGGADLGPEHQ